jgi:hypothetical protein
MLYYLQQKKMNAIPDQKADAQVLIRKKKRRYSDRLHWQAKFKNKLMASI